MEFDLDLLDSLIFVGALLMIFIDYPLAFFLDSAALAFGIIGINMELLDFALLQAVSQRFFDIIQN
ncbi:hypothetical protein [Candidatus Vondammii sp. HM_W22]|uniref:hypothetical protein n=1 Tax=Candidatus Vondammii sp. HM_W22 TaxID=2687299 RepID=UPI001F137B9B|nr:hypothetical protein [Candidatus Vondammii sp. HM_W22]